MSCQSCGAPLSAGSKFCGECGAEPPAASHSKFASEQLAEKINQARRAGVCSFAYTDKNPALQRWWLCNTCVEAGTFAEGAGVCEICASKCHSGHDIIQGGSATLFCECGYRGCKSMKIQEKAEVKRGAAAAGGGGGGGGAKIPGLLDVVPTVKPLQIENVIMETYCKRDDEATSIHMQYVVRNGQKFNPVQINFDFSKCVGVRFNIPDQSVVVKPGATQLVADLQNEPGEECSITVSFGYKLLPPDEAAVAAEKKKQAVERDASAGKLRSLGIKPTDPLDSIIQACQGAGVKYVDPDFPPEQSSLYARGIGNPLPIKELVWRRPEEFFNGARYALFDGITPTDINQGMLGNCWFCCALSSMAEFPAYVQRMFENKDANRAGVYRLRLYNEIDVEPVNVTIDDLVPCRPGGGPVFTHNKQNELWVILIEKAYAKMMGSYYQLKSGSPADAFSDLTGCPVEAFDFKHLKDEKARANFFTMLKRCDAQKCVMAASKQGEDKFSECGETPDNKIGLVPGHAYSLIDVKEGTVGGKNVQLIRLRNPWGRFEWKGEWGDTSPLWTAEAKRVFNPVFSDDDGTFFIPFRLFLANFDHVDICYASDPHGKPWKQHRAGGTFGNSVPSIASNFYEFRLGSQSTTYVSIFQADSRIPGSPPPIDFGAVVLDAGGNAVLYTKAEAKNRVNGTAVLPAGTYRVVPYTTGVHSRTRGAPVPFVVGIHTDHECRLTPIPSSAEGSTQAKIAVLRAFGEQQSWDGNSVYSLSNSGISLFGIQAAADKKCAFVEFSLDFSNSKSAASPTGSLVSTQRVRPGALALLMELAPVDPRKGYGYSYKSKLAYID